MEGKRVGNGEHYYVDSVSTVSVSDWCVVTTEAVAALRKRVHD